MKDALGVILYIGKAKSLRNRLTTYFQGEAHAEYRVERMVGRVHRFELILTETEAEALVLEATLIRKHKPKFNVRLKDDKAYPYLKLQLAETFPRLEWTRRVRQDGARYFGPFPSAWSARQVLRLLNRAFLLRDCSDNTFRHRSRPCLLHQMHQCSAPCVGLVTPAAYRRALEQVVEVLEGKSDRITKELRKGMEDAAEREEFEEAADLRDQMRSLEIITQTQVSAMDEGSPRDRDVLGLARDPGDGGHATFLEVRAGRLVSVRHFHLQNSDPSQPEAELVREVLVQHYLSAKALAEAADPETGTRPAREVLLPSCPIDATEIGALEEALSVSLRTADDGERGDLDRQLLAVARTNAQHALELTKRRVDGHGAEALEETREKLQLTRTPSRIECYDISNFQGTDAVGSRVVFLDGAPDKNLYRRYKIRTVEGQNDFAMMKEVLSRRFENSGEDLPDLVVVDGGKGQLAQAVAILDELNIQGVAVVGLAKARTESDFQSSEVKSSHERIFIPGRKNPVALLPHQGAYKLLVHVRDEAHRFAVAYHRALRKKRVLGGDPPG